MMEVEFYRGKDKSSHYYHQNSKMASKRYNDHGGMNRSQDSEGRSERSNFDYSSNRSERTLNGHANGKYGKMADNKSRGNGTEKDSASVASFDSTGKQKSFRRLITRFAEKTSMQGVPYINSAKFWWARLIWSIMLLVAIAVMTLHLWYLVDQYTSWPIQTKISLGFETLQFPEVTICNSNVMHKGRFDKYNGAQALKDLIEDLRPQNLVPDQFDPDYDPNKQNPPENNQPGETPEKNQPPEQNNAPDNQGPNQAQSTTPSGKAPPDNGLPPAQNRRRRFVDQYEQFNGTKYQPGGNRPDPRDVRKQEKDDYDGAIDAKTAIHDLFTEMYMDIIKSDRASLGHDIEDMLISCTFNGRECSDKMFTRHQTSEYGNCWSIRSDKFNVKRSGSAGGLTLILFLEVQEYLKSITTGYGARVQVHEQRTFPFPVDEGFYVPAATETDIGLRMIAIERLGGLYGKCDDGEAFGTKYSIKHTRRACQSICLNAEIIDKCKCFSEKAEEFARQKDTEIKPCRTLKEVECMVTKQKLFESQQLGCTCDNPCQETQYLKAVSQRQWPTDEYAMVLLQGICNKDKAVCANIRADIDDISKISKNFVKLNIYYEDLNYENITEVPEIEIQQFLSDVGGAIGLWIGLSMLSLCELIQLFVELCDYSVHKTMKESRLERNKRKKERRKRAINNEILAEKNENNWPNTTFRNEKKEGINGYPFASPNYGLDDISHP